ncbi:hypothetical protein [Teredinibacter purpureus]|uniref:hypothetical protein n=1 Tax=Teredinibacter purpureus TaxID=2731756 RepID=UPI0005F78AC9|nr:hypothetical protein [Teredinibacter purpureus]
MRNIVLIFIMQILVSNQCGAVTYAWWVTYELESKIESFQNIAVTELNSDFKSISILSCSPPATFSEEECAEIESNNLKLSVEGDFNSDGIIEVWRIGVAKSGQGQYYKILFATSKSGKLLHSLSTKYDRPGFSAFLVRGEILSWVMCMECGHLADVVWSGNAFMLDWGEDYG